MDQASDSSEHEMALVFQNELNIEDPFARPDTILVAPDGDVLLVVGEGKARVNLRVNSANLIAASKVFKNMFSHNFREGQELASRAIESSCANHEPVSIPLPDDDPKAVTIIVQMLHSPLNKVSQDKSIYSIIKYAEMVDKYFFQAALAQTTETLFICFLKHKGRHIAEVVSWLHAALLLDHSKAFKLVTKYLLLHYPPSDYEMVFLNSRLNGERLWQLLCKIAKYFICRRTSN